MNSSDLSSAAPFFLLNDCLSTILITFWVVSGDILNSKPSYSLNLLQRGASWNCRLCGFVWQWQAKYTVSWERTHVSLIKILHCLMKLSHLTCTFIHTLEMFLSVEPVIIMMTGDDDDDDDVIQTETSWRRPTSAELTLTYLTLSASYKVTTCQNSLFWELQISHWNNSKVSKTWLRNNKKKGHRVALNFFDMIEK